MVSKVEKLPKKPLITEESISSSIVMFTKELSTDVVQASKKMVATSNTLWNRYRDSRFRQLTHCQ